MEKVIITGADGFVGSHTVQWFLKNGIEVLALGRSAEPKRLTRHKKLRYLQCDITDSEAMLNKIPHGYYDTCLHFAWEGSAGPARADYRLQMKNALDTVECMKTVKQLGCRRFVCAGSIMEYEVEAAIHCQGSKPGMGYIYGMGKQVAHCMCKAIAADIGIELIWPMITNAYGIGERSPRFVNTTILKMIHHEELRFTAATQNYDFVYVDDVAKAFFLAAKCGKPFCEYMIGSGNAKPLKEFILEMKEACAPEAELIFGDIPFTGTNMPLDVFDNTALKRDCGFEAEVPFFEGSKMTMNWLNECEEQNDSQI